MPCQEVVSEQSARNTTLHGGLSRTHSLQVQSTGTALR